MKNEFKEVKPELIKDNVFKLIGKDWMLVTAGKLDKYNMMTASWGALGVLWNKNVCFCFIRPVRHTYKFMEENDYFTISVFDEKYRDILNFCGSKSGRDVNKMTETKLTAAQSDLGNVYFTQARLVLECKKIYFQDLNPKQFLDPKIAGNYPNKDYHRMYIGEIVKCLIR
ncbi:MAG: flavin reductase [Elusimicrobia bacterium RIFOXYA2_FULL_40_6]|nr:MAG: flavin reductase [Elusimicrobia bacterium RIFOXYA2_FULL_40_6]